MACACLFAVLPDFAQAAPRFARTTNNWTTTTWSATSCAAGTGAAVPAAGDDVTICSGVTVTLNANTASLNSLNVLGTLTFGDSGTVRTLTVTGNVTVSGTVNVSNNTATHSFVIGGNLTNNGTFDLVLDGNSLCNATFNGAGPQIIGGTSAGTTEFNNVSVTNSLTINKSGGAVTQTGTLTVGGALSVTSGTLNVSNSVTVTGLTTLDGTLSIASATGTKAFNGGVDINPGGTFSNNTVAEAVSIGGDFTNDGTFNSGTGAYTFNSAGQWAGGNTIAFGTGGVTVSAARTNNATVTVAGTLAITGAVTLTNNASVDAAGAITGSAAGSTWTNASNSTLFVGGALLATGTLNASASGNTVNYDGTGAQTIKLPAAGYFHLTSSNGNTKTLPAGTVDVGGDLTVETGTTLTANTNDPFVNVTGNMSINGTGVYQSSNNAARTLAITGNLSISGTYTGNGSPTTLAGDFTRTGTFTSGTGLFTFNGSVQQTLTGASTFTSATVNNSGAGLLLANDMTMTTAGAGTLTLTQGNIDANGNVLIVPRPCNTPSISRTSGHVIGLLRKTVPAGASTCTFEVGSGSNYTPVVLGLGAGTGTGTITASTTATAHPQSATSGLSSTNYLNRYWTMANTTATPAAATTATFNYISGSPVDVNAGTESGFVVKRYTGGVWNTTTAASCTPVAGAVCKGISDYAAGDFWIGEIPPPPPDSFNAVEVGGAINGRIFTKLRGVNFQLDIVAVLSSALYNSFGGDVRVDLVTGASAGLNCGGGSPTSVAGPVDVTLSSGRGTTSNFNVATAYGDVRVRMRYPTSSPTITYCSSDNFTIRPGTLTITSTDATNTGTSGTPVIKTGANFNLTAAGGAGYTGTPAGNFTGNVTGTPTAGTVGGSFSAADGSGNASGNFYYSEVGNFGLAVDAVRDTAFVLAADQGGGDCIASSTSNTLSGGKYGCWIGSAAVTQSTGSTGFGRFIPDNFNVSYNTPVIAPACGGFSYVGQTFNFTTSPSMTVTARSGTNNGLTNTTTVNYAGSYVKFTNTSLAPAAYDTQAERYLRFDALGGGATPALDVSQLPATTADPTIGTFTAGVGTFTFSGGGGLGFTRSATTPSAPFDADIALRLDVIDTDNVAFAGNPASFGAASAGGGMLFSDGVAATSTDKLMRYGRLRIGGASGSQTLPLRLPVEAQYWTGSVFSTNTLDACTTLAAGNVGLGNYGGNLNAGETTATIVNSPLQSGRSAIRLSAPGVGNQGSVDVTLNLGSGGNADACNAFAPAATAGNKTHLRGAWCNPPGSFSKDPSVRARFGINRGSDQTIYRREQ